jgi:hypothetical protein
VDILITPEHRRASYADGGCDVRRLMRRCRHHLKQHWSFLKQDSNPTEQRNKQMPEPTKTFAQFRSEKEEAGSRYRLPPEIEEILGGPPVLFGEDIEWYEKTRGVLAAAIAPEDCIIWIYVEDLTYHTAEILRFRRMKTARLNLGRERVLIEVICDGLKSKRIALKEEADLQEIVAMYFLGGPERDKLDDALGITETLVTARASVYQEETLKLIDKNLASLESRRIKTLREIENRRFAVARRLREKSEELFADHDHDASQKQGGVGTPPSH